MLAPPAGAQANDRWTVDDSQARAVLPKPRDDAFVTGGSLSCQAQRWTLGLDLAEGTDIAGDAAAMRVDGRAFAVGAAMRDRVLAIAVPRDALEPLKSGLRLDIALGSGAEERTADASFSLRGSRLAITAAGERCPPRDMAPYQAVTFTPYSSYSAIARDLRKDDIDAFSASTASQPALDAAMAEFGEGRRVLFARLCGSSWYYGSSGCNITGYAPAPEAAEGWREVYDTENVLLYIDPRPAAQGWPDIATLPARGAGAGRVWRWNGNGYSLHGELPEEEEEKTLGQE